MTSKLLLSTVLHPEKILREVRQLTMPSHPVPLKTYDESLAVLRRALNRAKLGDSGKIDGFARLDRLVRTVEQRTGPVADFERAIEHEHRISPELDGRSVVPKPAQLSLFTPQRQT